MTLSEKEKKTLIEFRIKQAFETAEVAELLVANKKFLSAANRIYYAIFYSLLALALKFGYKTSKHAQLIGWFNKNFIASEKIERVFGTIVRNCFEYRMTADYDSFVNFKVEDMNELLGEMRLFLNRIELFIKENE